MPYGAIKNKDLMLEKVFGKHSFLKSIGLGHGFLT